MNTTKLCCFLILLSAFHVFSASFGGREAKRKPQPERVLESGLGGTFSLIEHDVNQPTGCVEIRINNTYQSGNISYPIFFDESGGGIGGAGNFSSEITRSRLRWYVGPNPIGIDVYNSYEISMAWNDEFRKFATSDMGNKITNIRYGHLMSERKSDEPIRSLARFVYSTSDVLFQSDDKNQYGEPVQYKKLVFAMLYFNDDPMAQWALECERANFVNLQQLETTHKCMWIDHNSKHAVTKTVSKPYCW